MGASEPLGHPLLALPKGGLLWSRGRGEGGARSGPASAAVKGISGRQQFSTPSTAEPLPLSPGTRYSLHHDAPEPHETRIETRPKTRYLYLSMSRSMANGE